MAFSIEELIQIGLFIGIIIVFGLAAYIFLKNKGYLDRAKRKEKTEKRPEQKSYSFAKNRKMRKLEKIIPEKKLSKRPSLVEIKIGGNEGLWEPEEETPFSKKGVTKTTPPTKKPMPLKKEEITGPFWKKMIPEKKAAPAEKPIPIQKPKPEIKEVSKKKEEKPKSIFAELKEKLKAKPKTKKPEAKPVKTEEPKKEKILFETEEEKKKNEKKFVQKILESEEDELEKISKAIEPKTTQSTEQEKQETIEALKKEFANLDKKEKKDLWTKKGPEEKLVKETKPIPSTPAKKIEELKSNGKFASKPFLEKKPEQTPLPKKGVTKTTGEKERFQDEMKKLFEEKREAMGVKKTKAPKQPFLEKKLDQKTQTKAFLEKKLEKPVVKPTPPPKIKPEPEIKKEIKKPEIKPVKKEEKKGLLARFGFKKEKKIKLTKEEEEQAKKIMIVLKEKRSEYSREDMKEAMKNLGYNEKIVKEVLRRLKV